MTDASSRESGLNSVATQLFLPSISFTSDPVCPSGTSGELATIWSDVAFMQPDGLALNGLDQSGMALSWLSVVIIRLQWRITGLLSVTRRSLYGMVWHMSCKIVAFQKHSLERVLFNHFFFQIHTWLPANGPHDLMNETSARGKILIRPPTATLSKLMLWMQISVLHKLPAHHATVPVYTNARKIEPVCKKPYANSFYDKGGSGAKRSLRPLGVLS